MPSCASGATSPRQEDRITLPDRGLERRGTCRICRCTGQGQSLAMARPVDPLRQRLLMRHLKYSEALSEGIVRAMERDPNIYMTGIAVDYPSGIFGSTTEATKRFGPNRVFDSPAMENALTGIAVGAAAMGKRPIIVHPSNDFMFLGWTM